MIVRLAEQDEIDVMQNIYGPIAFPCVVAEDDGEVVGFLGTNDDKSAIYAGPLECNNIFTCSYLIQGYDNLMKAAGVTHWFNMVDHENEKMMKIAKASSQFEEIEYNDEGIWFKHKVAA